MPLTLNADDDGVDLLDVQPFLAQIDLDHGFLALV